MTKQSTVELFKIPSFNMPELESRLVKINRRASKIGVSPVSYEVVDTVTEIHPNFASKVASGKMAYENAPKVTYNLITINGQAPKIEGYTFIATLDHVTIPNNVLVNTVPTEEVVHDYHHDDGTCDHCNKIRRRRETFVLRNDDTNEEIRVGRQCVKDFIGHDPRQIANYLQGLYALTEDLTDIFEDDHISCGPQYYMFDKIAVLAYTSAIIKKFGWVSRAKAMDSVGSDATAQIVAETLIPSKTHQVESARVALINELFPTEEVYSSYKEEAQKAIDWLMEQNVENNNYLQNLQAINTQEDVPTRVFGYWCSLMATYQKAMDKLNAQKSAHKTNEWAGEKGEKGSFKVHLNSIKYVSGYYNTVALHNFTDDQGRTLVWFCNGNVTMDAGEDYTIVGTVKKLDEFNGWKQTVLTRVKAK